MGCRLDAPAGCSHTDLAQLAKPPAAAITGPLRHSSDSLWPAMGCSGLDIIRQTLPMLMQHAAIPTLCSK